jgi:ribosomal protein S12 methylthiotransferase accessory factor
MQQSAPETSGFRTIVFVGPSIPLDLARRTLPDAEYRPPVRRGDLDSIEPATVVGIIDGVFAQTLAISPGEIRDAIDRGVVVYGAASMGALRAAEVPRVIGVGRIFEMYRSGAIERDDEVALLFDPGSFKPLTEPMVNVRYAVDRLVRSATLSRDSGDRLVAACARLHYTERTYAAIVRDPSFAHHRDVADIVRLLRHFDLKREDAQFLLETLALHRIEGSSATTSTPAPSGTSGAGADRRARPTEPSDAPVLIWESGDSVQFDDLIRFLKLTGAFERFAADVLGRAAVAGRPMRMTAAGPIADDSGDEASAAQYLLDSTRLVWGWESPEEAHVTMRDLGLGLGDISASLEPQVVASRLVERFASHPPRAFKRALRTELWLNDLSLKREALRLGALQYFARLEGDHSELADSDIDDAKRTICRLRAAMQWSVARSDLRDLGVSDAELDGMVQQLARARRNGRPVVEALDRRPRIRPVPSRAARWRARGLDFEPSPKAGDSNRFSLPLADAATTADSIARQMGVVRIGLIGELDTLGIHVAQAFGERSGWSSSFSSGKAETREGARIGSVMEEAELHAQDAYQPRVALRASFSDGAGSAPLIDPRTLDLPFDSRYAATLELEWSPCHDLMTGTEVLVPSACLLGERQPNDIYYSPRLGGKIFSSSGLGSGFTLAEAAVHAAAEYIERHALRLAEIELDNPGGVGVRQFWFVDLDSLPETPRRRHVRSSSRHHVRHRRADVLRARLRRSVRNRPQHIVGWIWLPSRSGGRRHDGVAGGGADESGRDCRRPRRLLAAGAKPWPPRASAHHGAALAGVLVLQRPAAASVLRHDGLRHSGHPRRTRMDCRPGRRRRVRALPRGRLHDVSYSPGARSARPHPRRGVDQSAVHGRESPCDRDSRSVAARRHRAYLM